MKISATDGAKRGSGRWPLLSVLRGGRSGAVLARLPESMYGDFLDVPARVAVEAAHKLAELAQKAGVVPLSAEQRSQLGLKVNKKAWAVARQVANALGRLPEVVKATKVTPEFIYESEGKEGELRCFALAIQVAQDQVADSQRVLAAWQKEARAQVLGELTAALLDESLPMADRQRLLIDAAEVLSLEEEMESAQRVERAAGEREKEALRSRLSEAEDRVALLSTMEALREGKEVDPELLRRVAEHYARDGGEE